MFSRREFIQMAATTAAIYGSSSNWARAAATQAMTQSDLLEFNSKGQVTLLHVTDIHAQLKPLYLDHPQKILALEVLRASRLILLPKIF